MITYYPWSQEVLDECLSDQDQGALPTLDLEFTAKCTYASCIYCDSRPDVGRRHPNELNWRETERLLREGKDLGLKWIYSCGLGEPLEDSRFKRVLELSSELGIRVSIFSNGLLIDENMAKWLHDHSASLIIKLDTFDEQAFDTILGKKGTATKIYRALDLLLDNGFARCANQGYTDLALSVVPTRLNYKTIDAVLEFAIDKNIFPSVGELEQAGRALEGTIYSDLSLSGQEIMLLKKRVESLTWPAYTRPICPTILTGVHIDNIGDCVVDRETGLNCKWFLLREPETRILGNIRRNDLESLFQNTKEYRRKRFAKNHNGLKACESADFTFGGCGGSPKEIVRIARKHL
jgi:MoaA/NifB/PqqE/SkfB family radical SAM enzyme